MKIGFAPINKVSFIYSYPYREVLDCRLVSNRCHKTNFHFDFYCSVCCDTILVDFSISLFNGFIGLENRLRHQKHVFEKLIADRVEPENYYYEL